MRVISLPTLFAVFFGRSIGERRLLLKGLERMQSAERRIRSGMDFDILEIQLPKRKHYPLRIYTAWSLLHIVTFNKLTFLLGSIFILPACLISLWQLGSWLIGFTY